MKRMILAALLAAPLPALAQTGCPTYATIQDVGNVTLAQDTLTTVPPTGGANASGYKVVKLTVELTTAQKEATGNTLYLEADVSTDGGVTWAKQASIPWVSYGGPLTVNLPCQGNVVDPDPSMSLPLNGKTNAIYRLQYQAHGLLTAHPIFTGISN